ncbi:hypothetical protein B9Z55_027483 [Caenorhabditis nigoni]|uniref:Uncharacterized protein n=1 Tax=Caenorhabditis nigoni TaxID=1611254 RepID=A0A2G5SG89_9PELO|nr:hypothetical protein B9Z55_027483 [Caenorhabditis nigoni]
MAFSPSALSAILFQILGILGSLNSLVVDPNWRSLFGVCAFLFLCAFIFTVTVDYYYSNDSHAWMLPPLSRPYSVLYHTKCQHKKSRFQESFWSYVLLVVPVFVPHAATGYLDNCQTPAFTVALIIQLIVMAITIRNIIKLY